MPRFRLSQVETAMDGQPPMWRSESVRQMESSLAHCANWWHTSSQFSRSSIDSHNFTGSQVTTLCVVILCTSRIEEASSLGILKTGVPPSSIGREQKKRAK